MVKGKTITNGNGGEVLKSLKPSKVIVMDSNMDTKSIKKTIPITTEPLIPPTLSTPVVACTPNMSNTLEYVNDVKNIRYPLESLKNRFPGYNILYYQELFDVLESTDYNLNNININLNLQKLLNIGNNIQSQISRLHSNLELLSVNSFTVIKSNCSNDIGFFTPNDTLISIFNIFNHQIQNYYNTLQNELQQYQVMDFKKYDLINLYYDFFNFIYDEVLGKQLLPEHELQNSILTSRIISLNNSKMVLNQFKQLLQVELHARNLELSNLKEYLDVLKPSLALLQQQNFSEFKSKFKSFLKI